MSWLARRRGHRGLGILLGFAGGGLATGTAYIGGHLVYGRGVGVDETAFDRLPRNWTKVLDDADLPDGEPTRAEVGGVPLLLVRQHDRVFAIHDRCSHRGGPLHEGELDDGTITCPWHGSCFALDDGRILRGPATSPQPALQTRIHEGAVEVKR